MSVGTWRPFLDEVVLKGARAYALRMLAVKAEHQAKDDIATARTRLGSVAAIHTLTGTALGKITTHADLAKTSLDTVATWIGYADTAFDQIATQATAIVAAIAKAITELGKVNTDLTNAEGVWAEEAIYIGKSTTHLEAGEPTINKVNVGREVPELYATYAEREITIATLWANKREHFLVEAARHADTMGGYFTEASHRIGIASRYIEEGGGRLDAARVYIAEATARLQTCQEYSREAGTRIEEMRTYIAEAERYENLAMREMEISDRYKRDSDTAMVEFQAVLHDRAQYRTNILQAAVRQPR